MSTDHKAEAVEALAHSAKSHAMGNDPHGYAQAHATLYLAEQQKLANLIAYTDTLDALERDGHELDEKARADQRTLYRLIREGLGLA